MEKKSKNTVHWCGARTHDLSAQYADLHTDMADLEAKVIIFIHLHVISFIINKYIL